MRGACLMQSIASGAVWTDHWARSESVPAECEGNMADAAALLQSLGDATVLALEAAAAISILVSAGRAFLDFLSHLLRGDTLGRAERERFARGLLLGLDFTIGSDVLKIALSPQLDEVLVVGLVVLARVVLTLVLEHEINRAETRAARTPSPEANAASDRHA